MSKQEQVYLSRRNLMILLAKLDRNLENPGESACTVIKFQNPTDPFVQTMDAIAVTAIEDDQYYATRPAGPMHPNDEGTIATQEKPDVHTRDAPTPEPYITIGDPEQQTILTGRSLGMQMRDVYDLDMVDATERLVVHIKVLDNVYAVSSSFLLGMFEESMIAAGSREKFFEKFKFTMPNACHEILIGCVIRVFQMASLSKRA